MKTLQILTVSLFVMFYAGTVFAQGTQGQSFVFQVTGPYSNVVTFRELDPCGVRGTSGWGGVISTDFCAQLVWAYDLTLDSLACDAVAADYSGKIVMVRRGDCEFSLKALHAQQAGAIAVVVINHYDDVSEEPCTLVDMDEGSAGGQVTIPVLFASRKAGEVLAPMVASGTTEACFLLPRVSDAYAPYAYATPLNHVDTLYHMGFRIHNREDTAITDLVIKADIFGPDGWLDAVSTTIPSIAPGVDTFLFFPPYRPPFWAYYHMGKCKVVFTNNFYQESRDTLTREFIITDHTFALDNFDLMLDGGASRNDLFEQGGYQYWTGSLYRTGPALNTVSHLRFGIANIDDIYEPSLSNNFYLTAVIFDADMDEDGIINLSNDWLDIADGVVGVGYYDYLQGDEKEHLLIDVRIEHFIFPNCALQLKPRHPYYVGFFHGIDHPPGGPNIAFTNTAHVPYLNFPTTPMFLGEFHPEGWADRTLVHRMELEVFLTDQEPEPNVLDADKFSIAPNPGNTFVNLNLDLTEINKQVVVNIMSAQGQLVRQEVLRNFQSGQVRFDVKDVPSGTYLMWIRSEEGQTIQKVAICH